MSRYHAASLALGSLISFDIPIDGFTVSGKPPGPYKVYFPARGDKGHRGPPHVHVSRGNNRPAKITFNKNGGVTANKPGDFKKQELGKIAKKMHSNTKKIKRLWYKWQSQP